MLAAEVRSSLGGVAAVAALGRSQSADSDRRRAVGILHDCRSFDLSHSRRGSRRIVAARRSALVMAAALYALLALAVPRGHRMAVRVRTRRTPLKQPRYIVRDNRCSCG